MATFERKPNQTEQNPVAVPLKWNQPGKRWSVTLKWNGLDSTIKTMITKAIIDFTPYSAPELEPVAQVIHDKMLANADIFDDPAVAMTALATLISTYHTKFAARASNDSEAVLAFNLTRHDLEGALHDLGVYVNLTAKGDAMIVEKSGFPSYTIGGGTSPGPSAVPAAPENVKLRNGDASGSIIARAKPDRARSFNIAQINTGDPNNEAGWRTVMNFTGGKVTISGLTVATIVWVRLATIGVGGVIGAWSDPAKIVVQ